MRPTFWLALCSVALMAACDSQMSTDTDTDTVADDARAPVDLTDLQATLERGSELFAGSGACAECHGDRGEGLNGPSLTFGPSAYDIYYQLNTNPEMAESRDDMRASNDEIVALAAYVLDLTGGNVTAEVIAENVTSVANAREFEEFVPESYLLSEYDRGIAVIEDQDEALSDWQRRSQTGNIMRTFQSRVVATWDPGEPKFEPEPGKVYFYENTGANRPPGYEQDRAPSTSVVVGDAETKEVIASYQFPPELRTSMHATAVTPDGRYVYIPGPRPLLEGETQQTTSGTQLRYAIPGLDSSATIIKADALTLQPVEQVVVGGRMHHAQIFQDRYMLVDTFGREDDGLDVFLMDPETNEIIGGVRDEELGGSTYTAFTDNEFIYILMEPAGYGSSTAGGYLAALRYNQGEYTALRSFWVAVLDPETWEVVREYPYRGFSLELDHDRFGERVHVRSGKRERLRQQDQPCHGRDGMDDAHRTRALWRSAERGRIGTLGRRQGRDDRHVRAHAHRRRRGHRPSDRDAIRRLPDRPRAVVAQRTRGLGHQQYGRPGLCLGC